VIGVAVQPVLGVADGISSTMHGITYNVGEYRTPEVIRSPRHLQTLDGMSPQAFTGNMGGLSGGGSSRPTSLGLRETYGGSIIIPLEKELDLERGSTLEMREAITEHDIRESRDCFAGGISDIGCGAFVRNAYL